MTPRQYTYQKAQRDRERILKILAESRAKAQPEKVEDAAGFWLERQAPERQRSHAS
jgi:hypothetical protein